MAAPRQMTANTLNALKGWPSQHAVDFHAKFDAVQLAASEPILAGSVVSLNDSGDFEIGVGTQNRMPLFLFNNSDDPDVENDGGNAGAGGDKGVWVPVAPTGQAMALVCVGAYELTSTNFVGTSANLKPNDILYSPHQAVPGTPSTNEGKLVEGSYLDDNTIVGIVSRGVVDNGYGHDSVAFWPWCLPAAINHS